MGTTEITKNIDMMSILKRFREIDNLKLCLFSERQRILFDNIPKPQFIVNTNLDPGMHGFVRISGWVESYEGNKEKLSYAYRTLKSTENKSLIDKQLLLLYQGNYEIIDKQYV